MLVTRFLFVVAVLLVIGGCSGSDSPSAPDNDVPSPPSDISFSGEVLPIFASAGCAASSCHSTSRQSAGLVLTASAAYDRLVNVNSSQVSTFKRVLPGDAQNSYLMMKLEGRQTVGNRMPLGQAPLSSRNLQVIGTWINEGAADN